MDHIFQNLTQSIFAWIQRLIRKDYNTELTGREKQMFKQALVLKSLAVIGQVFFLVAKLLILLHGFPQQNPALAAQILFGTAIFTACIPQLTTVRADLSLSWQMWESFWQCHGYCLHRSDRSRSSDSASDMLKLGTNSIDIRIILNPECLPQPLASKPCPWKDSVIWAWRAPN